MGAWKLNFSIKEINLFIEIKILSVFDVKC
jgi:hypothetical protein